MINSTSLLFHIYKIKHFSNTDEKDVIIALHFSQ